MKSRRAATAFQPQQDLDQASAPSAEPGAAAMLASQGSLGNHFIAQLAAAGGELPFRAELEAAFGQDFSGVSVATGQADALSAINARAAASGEHIAFAEPKPDRQLVAHELTHVVQQRQAGAAVQRAGMSRSGDAAEREADAVGEAVAAGQAAPPITQAPSAGIQREEESLENDVVVREGEGECFAMDQDAEDLIDAFTTSAHEGIGAWASIREGSSLYFDDRELKQLWLDFHSDWTKLDSNPNGLAFEKTPEAVEEVRRQLNSGTTPQFVEEITLFNRGALRTYAELLELEPEELLHHYDLLAVLAVSGGGGEVIQGEVAVSRFEIRYSNSLKMSWSQRTTCLSAGAGSGLSISPISVNMESSAGNTSVNAGGADTTHYYAPDFFDAALMGYTSGEALAGGGTSLGSVEFSDGDSSITFDTSGLIAKAGTDVVGSASAMVGGGVCGDLSTDDGVDLGDVRPPVEEQPREGSWTPLIDAAVFFPTGDASLDSDDIDTLEQVAGAILKHEESSPGDIFQVAIVGSASNRWRGETGEASPEELNESLADDRASAVQTALTGELLDVESQFTEGVFDESVMAKLTRSSSSVDPDDNSQIDRSVFIRVLYNPCGKGGNVDG